jgi:hypothetical protein
MFPSVSVDCSCSRCFKVSSKSRLAIKFMARSMQKQGHILFDISRKDGMSFAVLSSKKYQNAKIHKR